MLLSVVSALARLNVDPWEEAKELAQLPGEMARQRLASLIAALPEVPSVHRDSETIAARLIALLPSQAGSNRSAGKERLDGGISAPTSAHVVIYVIVMAIILGSQMVAGRQMFAPIDGSQAPKSSADIPQVPLR